VSPLDPITVAVVQATPMFLHAQETLEKVVALAGEAAGRGASLIAFPEAFVPSYPEWVWRLAPWSGPSGGLYARLLEQAVQVPGPVTRRIGLAAADAGAYLTIGVSERESAGSTVFNSLLTFAPDGSLIGRHRKLMATGGERLVWGIGDGSTLGVHETPFGRLGGLICWENYMPLARAALYARGIDVWVAPTWDDDPVWLSTLQHIAKEGRVHVLGVNSVIRATDIPTDVPGYDQVWAGDDSWMSEGRSAIVGPRGEILAGPLVQEEGILTAQIDVERARSLRLEFDPTGHYLRPDVFDLRVHTQPAMGVSFSPIEGQAIGEGGRPMVDVQELHRRAVEGFGERVRAIGDDRWHLSTPCTEWDVRALVNHLTGENLWTVPLFEGQTIEQVGSRFDGDVLGDDPAATYRASEEAAIAVVQGPGALERTVELSRGPTPGRDYAMELLFDFTIHAWDLARGIRGDEKLDPELVAVCSEWFRPMEEMYRASGAIVERTPVPDDADAQTVLLAMTGRTV
jgi:nitrilase